MWKTMRWYLVVSSLAIFFGMRATAQENPADRGSTESTAAMNSGFEFDPGWIGLCGILGLFGLLGRGPADRPPHRVAANLPGAERE